MIAFVDVAAPQYDEAAHQISCQLALYWDFHVKHTDKLAANPRIGMVYQQLKKMDTGKIEALQAQAARLRGRLEQL